MKKNSLKKSPLRVILLSVLLFSWAGCEKEATQNRLLAIQYGHSLFPANQIYQRSESQDKKPFAWMFYVYQTTHQTILIDTRFNDPTKKKTYQIQNFTDPLEQLKKQNILPEKVTHLILTHHHFDHTDLLSSFPQAHIYVTKKTYEVLIKSPNHQDFLARQQNLGKINFTGSETQITSWIKTQKTGGHTRGHQAVSIMHNNKTYLLVGDECYLQEGCRQQKISGTLQDKAAHKRFLQSIQETKKHILPFHDPIIQTQYKKIAPGVVQIF